MPALPTSRGGRLPSPRRHAGTAALATLCSSVLALTAAGATASAAPAPAATPTAVGAATTSATAASGLTITGKGFGHGHGMSQWGAYGAATQGVSWQQIIAHYYPGTTMSAIGNPTVRVSLRSDLGQAAVTAAPGLVATYGSGHTGAAALPTTGPDGTAMRRFTVTAVDGANATLSYVTAGGRTGTWGAVSPQVNLTSSSGVVPALGTTAGRVGSVYGELRGVMSGGAVAPVAAIPMDQYLRGVVPHESPASWPAAALAAQAVAARSYALWQMARPQSAAYDVCDSTACQVFQARGFYAATDAAIAATAGTALRYQGQPAFTQFGASTGGWNSSGGTPYLVAQPDPWDATPANPNDAWTVTVSAASLQARWPSIGTFTGVQVLGRDGAGSWGGRVTRAAVTGTAGSVTVSGDSLMASLGLRSTYFTVADVRPDVVGVLAGGGVGGAVGLQAALGGVGYQAVGPLSTSALTGVDPAIWRFLPGRRSDGVHPDLVAVRTAGTASGRMEVVTATSASGYRTLTRAVTPYPMFLPDRGTSIVAGRNGDVCLVVVGRTGSGRAEMHCLSAATGYTGWSVHAALPLSAQTSLIGQTFLVVPTTGDLALVLQSGPTGSGRAELHRLSASSNYASWVDHRALPLGLSSPTTARFLIQPTTGAAPDVLYVPLSGTGSGRVEVHVVSASSGYTAFGLHAATAIAPKSFPAYQPEMG